MSTYRYFTTNILTGAVGADTLPLHVSSFSRNLGNVGQPGMLTGYLDLGSLPAAVQSSYLGALEPRRTLLWVEQDGLPVWCGVLWDWPVTTVVTNQLPIQATEIGSLFGRRQVRADQTFSAGTDLFAVVQGLLNYTLAKTNGGVSGLVVGTATAGTTVGGTGITFAASNLLKILDSINQFATQYGLEYAFTPGWDSTGTVPTVTLQLGYPTLRRPYSATNLQLVYPSQYVLDYGFPRIGNASVNSLLATAQSPGQQPWQSGSAHGQNSTDFSRGYPLLEDSIPYTAAAVTSQTQIDAFADGQIGKLTGTTTVPTVTIGGGGIPTVGQIQLGDEAELEATSPLHPADPVSGAPGLQQLVRIIGWTVKPPDLQANQPESTVLALGGVTT